MFKIRIIAIGKDKDRWITDGCLHYQKLLSRFADVQWTVISPAKATSTTPANQIKRQEGERLIREFTRGIHVALSDHGETMDSPSLAQLLEKWLAQSSGMISFFVGGAYGLDDAILDRADMVLSLSPLTFSHQLVRPLLLEQLYRAFSIIHGTAYHK